MDSKEVVGILGIGLIGGSMALDLKKSGWAKKCIGIDTGRKNQKRALELGLIDELKPLEVALKELTVLIIAVPVDNLVAALPEILNKLNPNQVVIEVGSTKTPIYEAIKNHPKRKQFVSTHPMAGTEFSGPEAAFEGLFKNKRAVICDEELSDVDLVKRIEDLYQTGLGMNLIYMDSISHDVHTAYISHISHICSFALANTVLEKEKDEKRIFELASTGFESTVRLAKSSPETWIQIFHQNQENLLDVLDEYINTLLKYKGLLLAGSYEKLKEELEKANDIKRVLKG
ncbi:prephenate dehydrogenase [Sandaracinomonas limnophila]|uniref:Prephenate dehydrogenase n=1 Tax=Sandaracinomonas limnophila TaxID=1862386 RepID=A0A437PRS2_9BACT|nr:prephenate dehydrogenase [Sandaracinomonas limnophila]RVU24964.1 prephenate dehydrogenase [Sandaracinomonas limnophila]